MIKIVELSSDGRLQLPDGIAQHFNPTDRFLVWAEGDTILFKRIETPRVTDIVAEAPETVEPMSMEEISEIVHEVRRKGAPKD